MRKRKGDNIYFLLDIRGVLVENNYMHLKDKTESLLLQNKIDVMLKIIEHYHK